jgi:hypothetical protein
MLNAFAEKIANDLLPRYGDGLACEFDEVRTKDRVLELQEMEAYSKTHTVAEVRKKFWMDDPLGDERDELFPIQVNAAVGNGDEPEPEPAPIMQPAPMVQQQDQQPAPQENGNESEPLEDDGEEMAEVKRWRRVARKCVEQGKPVKEFKTSIIPQADYDRISALLKTCKTVADVDAAFVRTTAEDRIAAALERLLAAA